MGEGEGGGGEERGRPDTKPFSSLPFSFPSFHFSPETLDTQARYFAVIGHETRTLS